ncbi:MAG: AgrD family cyclic lactone autoinducer peptide [Eubacteriaceae bacterium]
MLIASKLIKRVVKLDGTKASFGLYYQPKRKK